MGLLAGLLEETGLGPAKQKEILTAVREKNVHELRAACAAQDVAPKTAESLAFLAGIYGGLKETLPAVRKLCRGSRMEKAYEELSELCSCLEECGVSGHVNLDFSIVNDMDYYNGIIFQGFINGIPSGILSGGRYDNLVHKLGKQADAIGFAVYLDLLERFATEKKEFDTDVLLIYGDGDSPAAVAAEVRRLTDGGERVMAVRTEPRDVRFRRRLTMKDGEARK